MTYTIAMVVTWRVSMPRSWDTTSVRCDAPRLLLSLNSLDI